MAGINLRRDQSFALNSREHPVSPGKYYEVSAEATGLRGAAYCAYLAIIFVDGNGKEVVRRIRWLKDISGKPVRYSIVAAAPASAERAVLGLRFNTEHAVSAESEFVVGDIEALPLVEKEATEESYDALDDFLKGEAALIDFVPLTATQEAVVEENIVWVLCSPRSGSSWLARQLLSHPGHVTWDEPFIGVHMGAMPSNDPGRLSRLYDGAMNSTQYFFLPYFERAWMPFLRSMVLNRCYAQFPDALRKKVVIKEPWGSLGADLIMRCLPLSKMIFLVRDGRDVVDSYLDMRNPGSWASKNWGSLLKPVVGSQARLTAVGNHSRIWSFVIGIIKRAYEAHDPGRRLMMKYEDLRHDTLTELRNIYTFIGTEVADPYLKDIVEKFSFENIPKGEKGPGKFTRRAKPGGWKTAFSEEEIAVMNDIMGGQLKELGYDID